MQPCDGHDHNAVVGWIQSQTARLIADEVSNFVTEEARTEENSRQQ